MKRALTTAAIAVVALAGCMADEPDAAPQSRVTDPRTADPRTTDPRTTDPVPRRTNGPSVTIDGRPRPSGFGRARLTFFGDCPDLLDYMRTEALARVTAWGLGGGPWYWYGDAASAEDGGGRLAAPAADLAVPQDAPASTTPHSGTNTQEAGVDEGDVVETDGAYVYVAARDSVKIIAVADADIVATAKLPTGSQQMLLDGQRLLVATQPDTGVEDTIVTLFDVSNPASPMLMRRSHLEGRVVATRSIDGVARLVLTTSLAARLPFVQPTQFGLDEDLALERNKEIIRTSAVDDWLPRWFDEGANGSFGEMSNTLDCSTVAAPRDFAGLGVSWIASVDLRNGGAPVGGAGIVSNGETVYASPTAIYLATQNWDWYVSDQRQGAPDEAPPTMIHAFNLGGDGTASYLASGEVPGRLLNQFAMSELDGDLRVATTVEDWSGNGASESAVRVLRRDGDELVEIGAVGGLGKTEQIYAVRFLGTQAYVVTFRQTDPLYVVDLSDPTAPAVTGELKIPGYSAYLHPVGDGLLLGVGQDATEDGRVLGTKLTLFDVSDPAAPAVLSSLPIGGYSEVEWDHKAFLYWPEDGTIVLPVSPGWMDCGPNDQCLAGRIESPAGGVVVARLDGTTLVAQGTVSAESNSNNGGCWNPLQRSLAIGSELVTVGFDQLTFSDRATLERRDTVRWGQPDEYGCYYYAGG